MNRWYDTSSYFLLSLKGNIIPSREFIHFCLPIVLKFPMKQTLDIVINCSEFLTLTTNRTNISYWTIQLIFHLTHALENVTTWQNHLSKIFMPIVSIFLIRHNILDLFYYIYISRRKFLEYLRYSVLYCVGTNRIPCVAWNHMHKQMHKRLSTIKISSI